MKKYVKIILGFIFLMSIVSCYQGIDPITEVAPGPDLSAPEISVSYPLEGTQIKAKDLITSIDIKFEVIDDIEIGSIDVTLDGNNIGSFSEFKDYRHAIETLTYDSLSNGDHVLSIKAIDLEGKETVKTINFSKVPPYTALFAGEVLYMPFDGDFNDLISFQSASVVGNPGFTDDKFAGDKAYMGAEDSYLTFPLDGLNTPEFSAGFWYKVNASPDRSGIITIGKDDNRTQGLRLFREGDANKQRIKLNVGTGAGESWNDGGEITVANGEWVYVTFTVSQTETKIYFNGQLMNTASMGSPIDWTGCNSITIGSGEPTFSYWGHLSDSSPFDELRIFNKELSQTEIQNIINKTNPYTPMYSGEIFYMPFENTYTEKISGTDATIVGSPGFAGVGYLGNDAYAGATDSYLTFPSDGLTNNEFSATMWYKLDNNPDRAGILVMGPEDSGNSNYPDVQNLRTNGFRFFREDNGSGLQRFKLNVGNGTADEWLDGGSNADVDPASGNWVFLAFTISQSEAVVYIDGQIVAQGSIAGLDWTGCDILSIMSGAPRFTEWGHFSDLSYLDELRLYNKALTQTEVQNVMNGN